MRELLKIKLPKFNPVKLLSAILFILAAIFLAGLYFGKDSDLVQYTLCQELHECVTLETTKEFVPNSIAYGFFPMDGNHEWPLVTMVEWPTMHPAKHSFFSKILTTKEDGEFFLIIRASGARQDLKLESMYRDAVEVSNGATNILGMLKNTKISNQLHYNVFVDGDDKWIFPSNNALWNIYCMPTFKTKTCNL